MGKEREKHVCVTPRQQGGACGPLAGQLFAKHLKGERELVKGDMMSREWKRFR